MAYRFYFKIKGQAQGPFAAEASDASVGDGYSLAYRYRFKGSVTDDPTRGGEKGAAVRSHEPLILVKPWGAATPALLAAFWSNEVLEVDLTFVRLDGSGKETPFQKIALKGATIASFEQLAGDDVTVEESGSPGHGQLEQVAFRFEQMDLKNIPASTAAKYDWKNRA